MTQPTEEQIALARSNRLLEENERKLAFVNGKIDAIIDVIATDPEHIELLRHLAWAKTGMKFSMIDGHVSGAPPGWPDKFPQTEFIDKWISVQKTAHPPFSNESNESENHSSNRVIEFRSQI